MQFWTTKLATGAFALAVLSLASCKKDEVRTTLTPANSATLTASTANVTLLSVNGAQSAITYTWTPIKLNWNTTDGTSYSPAVTYTLQYDKKGNNFAAPVSVDAGTLATKTLTAAALNSSLISLGLAPEVTADVETRLMATYASNSTPLYSPTVALTVKPYSTELYVSSSYLNNNLASAPKLLEIDGSPRVYQGYVYFGGTTTSTFKVTNTRAGTGSYYGNSGTSAVAVGALGVETTGAVTTPGNNFSIAPGYYLMKVDLGTMQWSVTPYSWAVVGDATANGWTADTPLTYDASKGLWTVTTALTPAKFKFRANGNWTVSLGSTTPVGTYLTSNGGGDLTSPGTGTYTISLDLSNPAKPTYTIGN